jgi:hypothetical protein
MNTCTLEPAVEPADHRALAALARDIWYEHYPAIISRDPLASAG